MKQFNFCVILSVTCLVIAGCSSVELADPALLDEFNRAGPLQPQVDIDRLVAARTTSGLYRVVSDDVLQIQIPVILRAVHIEDLDSLELGRPYECRVYDDGTITLPLIGKVQAAGRRLAQIETAITEAYYPRWYSVERPSIVARVVEYRTAKVSIVGGVKNPGTYRLHSDEMTLVSLIMKAGGIVEEGAGFIRISHQARAALDDDIAETAKHAGSAARQSPKKKLTPLNSDEDLQLAFSQTNPQGTIGRLTMKDNGTIVLAQQMDISSGLQRQAVLDKLAQKNYSTAKVNVRLCELAEMMEPGSVKLIANQKQDNAAIDELSRLLESSKPKQKQKEPQPIVLPVKRLNIPFADVALMDGDSIEVEMLDPRVFTVIGLVKQPGAFRYPPTVVYNVLQALAFAGGIDQITEPRYVRVYRQTAEGRMVDATFEIKGTSPIGAANIIIKPGDIVAVEQTSRTRMKLLLAEVLAIRVGTSFSYQIFGGEDFRRTD